MKSVQVLSYSLYSTDTEKMFSTYLFFIFTVTVAVYSFTPALIM